MSIVIDRTVEDNNQITAFDNSFVQQLNAYLYDVTFTDTTKHLSNDVQQSVAGDQLFIPNIDYFNALSLSKDFDMIVYAEMLKTYSTNTQRILYYNVAVEYNPLKCTYYSNQFVNILINLQDGNNQGDTTNVYVGTKYAFQDKFSLDNPINCVLQLRPSAKKVTTGLSNYLGQSVDFIFFVSIDKNLIVCGP